MATSPCNSECLTVKTAQLIVAFTLAGLLAACQFPTKSGGSGSPSPPTPSGSSSPAGSPSPPGTPSPSGSPSPPGMPSPSGSSGSSGPQGSPPSGSSAGGGESLPWPGGDEGGAEGGSDSLEGLDEQLDDALGDFDEAMGQGGADEEEIDILDPMSSGSSGAQSEQPVFEEGGSGEEGGSVENEGVAQRAASGAPGSESGSSQSGQQGGASSSGGGGGSSPVNGEQDGSSTTGEAEEGNTDIIPIPDDVGDGRNDDIVMRQIREAAMNEKDPVLRERLWDEYRRIRDR